MPEQETPQGGMRITRSVDPKNIPPKDQYAEIQQRQQQDEVARQLKGESSAMPINTVPAPEDALVIELPDHRVMELGPPGIATGFMMARMIADAGVKDAASAFTAQNYLRALLYVRKVNGQAVPRPTTMTDAQALANSIGDMGMEHVSLAVSQEWPMPTEGDLKVIRKPSTTRSS